MKRTEKLGHQIQIWVWQFQFIILFSFKSEKLSLTTVSALFLGNQSFIKNEGFADLANPPFFFFKCGSEVSREKQFSTAFLTHPA